MTMDTCLNINLPLLSFLWFDFILWYPSSVDKDSLPIGKSQHENWNGHIWSQLIVKFLHPVSKMIIPPRPGNNINLFHLTLYQWFWMVWWYVHQTLAAFPCPLHHVHLHSVTLEIHGVPLNVQMFHAIWHVDTPDLLISVCQYYHW